MASRRPLLKTLVAVAALALVATACGGGGGKKAASNATTTSVQDTSTTVADTSTTAAGGSTATTKAGQKPATTVGARVNGQPAGNYQPPAGAKAAAPATPGVYQYDNQSTGTNTFGPPPTPTPLKIDAPQGTRQHSTNDMTSGNKGTVTETTFDYKPEGVYLVDVLITNKTALGNQTIHFVGNPPPLAAPTGVKPGQSVEFDLSSDPPGTSIHLKVDFVRNETLTVGGQSVDTLVIHQVGTLSGNVRGTQSADSWVSPKYNLFVKTHSVGDVTASGVNVKSDVTSTLQKLTPG
jgi:hypothetical protein